MSTFSEKKKKKERQKAMEINRGVWKKKRAIDQSIVKQGANHGLYGGDGSYLGALVLQ